MGRIVLTIVVVVGCAICLALLFGCLVGTVVLNDWADLIADWVDDRKREKEEDKDD